VNVGKGGRRGELLEEDAVFLLKTYNTAVHEKPRTMKNIRDSFVGRWFEEVWNNFDLLAMTRK
jgi:hypothetical protein